MQAGESALMTATGGDRFIVNARQLHMHLKIGMLQQIMGEMQTLISVLRGSLVVSNVR